MVRRQPVRRRVGPDRQQFGEQTEGTATIATGIARKPIGLRSSSLPPDLGRSARAGSRRLWLVDGLVPAAGWEWAKVRAAN